jgi:3-dehydroquinate dehydratase-2
MTHFNIIIINGANLNLLGKREPHIYGNLSFEEYFLTLREKYSTENIHLHYFQSNHEGELLDKIHEVGFSFKGIILNAGAFTHTSIALRDAIAGITTPTIEVHISNVYAREEFRHYSYISAKCVGSITGLGLKGYDLAIEYFCKDL